MKRTILLFMLAFGIIALVSAQGNNRWGPNPPRGPNSPRMPNTPREQVLPRGPGFHHMGPQQFSWGRNNQRNARPAAETVSVSGNLTISQGMIAVASGETTYLVGGLNRFIGFIDGFKEGAAVTLEGYAMSSPRDSKVKYLRAQKMSLNGKDYELAPQWRQMQQRGR